MDPFMRSCCSASPCGGAVSRYASNPGSSSADTAAGSAATLDTAAASPTRSDSVGRRPLYAQQALRTCWEGAIMTLEDRGNLRTVRVIAVDPHPLYRDGVARVVRQDPDMRLVAEPDHAGAALAAVVDLQPDVVVLDPTMPRLNGKRLLSLIA